MKMVALHGFKSPEGKFAKNEVFDEPKDAERVKFLTEGGYAKKVSDAEAKALPPVAEVNPAAINAPTQKAKE